MNEEVERLKKENEALKNRCFVFSRGLFCSRCPFDCEQRKAPFYFEVKESEEE